MSNISNVLKAKPGSRSLDGKMIIDTDYQPRPLQEFIHSKLKRFNVLVCHRGFGKTILVINELIDQGLRCKNIDPSYAYIAPTYGQAERIAWDILKRYTKNIPGVVYNETKLTCTIPRPATQDKIKITLLGSENPDSIRGMHLDGVVLDEYAQMNPIIWGQIIRPALSNKRGWAIFIGTPKGENHFSDIYKIAVKNESGDWYSAIFRASQTKVLPDPELRAMRAEMSDEEWEQEMECSFAAALTGAYWGKQIAEVEKKARVCLLDHDPALTVDTFWDLGISDTMTCWFVQQSRMEVRIIDYYEASGEGLEFYGLMLKKDHRRIYNYNEHHWPHDGNSRDLSTGRERSTTFRGLITGRLVVHKKYDVADSINASRRLLARCWFDSEKTFRGLECLKNYQKRYDAKNKIWLDGPLHNWASHGSDSFRLMGMALRPDTSAQKKNLPRETSSHYDVFKSGRG